jgi:hypothetical protein
MRHGHHEGGIAVIHLMIVLACMSVIAGCAGMSRESGKALGDAGQVAAQALADQSDAARKTLDVLPEWWGVHDALVCANVAAGAPRTTCLDEVRAQVTNPQSRTQLSQAQKDLSIVMAKRTAAATALRDAYQSFVTLATYDAGAETEKAIKTALGAVNDLTKAAATIAPQGVALSAVSATFTSATSRVGGFVAAIRQEHQMLLASHDLHAASDAMTAALAVERDKAAAESLFALLRAESDQLYSSFVQSGLVAPKDALAPLLAQIAPGVQMAQVTPSANADVIAIAAVISLVERSRRQQAAMAASYDAALAALKSLSAEHAKLERGQRLDLSGILGQAKRVEAILSDLNRAK